MVTFTLKNGIISSGTSTGVTSRFIDNPFVSGFVYVTVNREKSSALDVPCVHDAHHGGEGGKPTSPLLSTLRPGQALVEPPVVVH